MRRLQSRHLPCLGGTVVVVISGMMLGRRPLTTTPWPSPEFVPRSGRVSCPAALRRAVLGDHRLTAPQGFQQPVANVVAIRPSADVAHGVGNAHQHRLPTPSRTQVKKFIHIASYPKCAI